MHIRHRGFAHCEGLREGFPETLDFEMCLQRKGFCDMREGFEGLARVYLRERGGERQAAPVRMVAAKRTVNDGFYVRKPSIPSLFHLNRLKVND